MDFQNTYENKRAAYFGKYRYNLFKEIDKNDKFLSYTNRIKIIF